MSPRSTWTWTFAGWVLFTVSAIFFCVAAVRDGGLIGLAASSSFLVACVVFIVPAVLNRPRSD